MRVPLKRIASSRSRDLRLVRPCGDVRINARSFVTVFACKKRYKSTVLMFENKRFKGKNTVTYFKHIPLEIFVMRIMLDACLVQFPVNCSVITA